jgi:hypothetical protein
MKLKKKKFILCCLSFLFILNGCIQTPVAFIGPAITVSQTGNVYQAGLSYISNDVIKKELGKTPIEYVKDIMVKSPKKIEPGQVQTLTNQFNYEQGLSSSVNNNKDYDEFLNAVKKILK